LTRLSEFDYELPRELIAHEPSLERDGSRLLRLSPDGGHHHGSFRDLPSLLKPGDVLVLNDTRVVPARLLGRRRGPRARGLEEGGVAELLVLGELGGGRFRVLARPARKIRVGDRIDFGNGRLEAEVLETEPEGRRIVRFAFEGRFESLLDELGTTPLPPYIETAQDEAALRTRYQTVYARPKGSVAAPTAGLHFTEAVLRELDERGVSTAFLTLHVGYATFAPVRGDVIEEHVMGTERYLVPGETRERIRAAREAGKRVVAVGTTTVRALESAARDEPSSDFRETPLFITPGFEFRWVSGLLTNFHLPRTTLLLLVSALGGTENVLAAYREAVKERYRFYSFGDAMLLYPARHGAVP
jgi:S-adenosylmethionine:tRNA ribosyltransferase-isomerase